MLLSGHWLIRHWFLYAGKGFPSLQLIFLQKPVWALQMLPLASPNYTRLVEISSSFVCSRNWWKDRDLLYCRSEAHSASALFWCCWMASAKTLNTNLRGVWLFLSPSLPEAVFGNYLTGSAVLVMQLWWEEAWRGGSAATVAVKCHLVSDGLYLCPWDNNGRNERAKCEPGCVLGRGKERMLEDLQAKGNVFILTLLLNVAQYCCVYKPVCNLSVRLNFWPTLCYLLVNMCRIRTFLYKADYWSIL